MNKVLIMGCCGSGKTTLAEQINKLCGLPIISLDQHYFQPGWVETPQIEWQKKVKKLAARPRWVMDGNYRSTLKRLDWEFLHYVLTFNVRNRRKNYKFLSQQKTTKTVVILKNQSIVDLYINSLKT